jgi:D-alanine-D-alanine ligase
MLNHVETGKFRGRPVGVVLGGDSDEREVSLSTGRALTGALKSLGYDVTVYDVPRDIDRLVADRPAAVLLGLHGGSGENGTFQGFLEALGIPYSGSGVLASALAMDKARAKAILRTADVPTPNSLFVDDVASADAEAIGATLGWPLVAKVNDGGSSVGVFLCHDEAELASALDALSATSGVLLEQYIEGEEFTVGFFDHVCLGVIRVDAANEFYDFDAKYDSDQTEYHPVEPEHPLFDRLVSLAETTYETLGCRGVARVDVIARDRELFVLEANTIPGMTATSLIPKMARRLGIEFDVFVERMLDAATTDDT